MASSIHPMTRSPCFSASVHSYPQGKRFSGRSCLQDAFSGGKRSRACRNGEPTPRPASAPSPPDLAQHVPRAAVPCSESSGRGVCPTTRRRHSSWGSERARWRSAVSWANEPFSGLSRVAVGFVQCAHPYPPPTTQRCPSTCRGGADRGPSGSRDPPLRPPRVRPGSEPGRGPRRSREDETR